MDRQHLDNGAIQVKPVHLADTVLVQVVNLSAYVQGQAPHFTWDLGDRASDVLFVRLGPCYFLDCLTLFLRHITVVLLVLGRVCPISLWLGSMSTYSATDGRSFVGNQ